MIQFAYPLALLALLSIPLILALHLLRPRPSRVVLSTTTLWQAAHNDRTQNLGLRRLLRNLSLVLLLAAALALGLALAGPQWLTHAGERDDTVLVLDVSASMKTRSGIGTTRFDQALAEAGRIIDGLPREGRMLVMTSGHKALLRTGFETDRGALRRVLSQLRAGDEAGRPREALALALSLLRDREHGRIYFVTDGAFASDVDPGSPQVVFRIVGGRAQNVAITRFDFRQELASEDRFQVLMTVRNYTDAPVAVPVTVDLDGRTLFRRSLELKARDEQTVILPLSGRAVGQAVARIDVNDDLAADNQAFAVVSMDHPLRVLLFSSGNFYLESELDALPGVHLVKREWSPTEDIERLAQTHDVVVLDGIAAPALPSGNFLLVNTVAPGLPFSDAGRVARPHVLGRGPSALMRDVDLTAVRIEQARRIVIQNEVPGLHRLFWSRETDLALALLDEDLKLVYLGFDLASSNFPLQLAFPLFLSQSLEWLRPRGNGAASTRIAAGSTYSLEIPPGETQLIMRMPSGDAATLEVKGGTFQFDAATEAGIYRYSVGGVTRHFAVALTDAQESDINSHWASGKQGEDVRPVDGDARAWAPLWPHLLVLALLLLALEWWAWTGSRSSA